MRSWWLRQVAPDQSEAPLEDALRADVCIVGGGFTGLWTALRIKEHDPGADVVLIEADICGGGASGRNGGFAMSFWHHFTGLERACGSAEALRLAQASCAALADIGGFCEEHGIDAHYRHEGWLWTATSESQRGAWESTIDAIERHGQRPFLAIDANEVAARSGSPAHLAGVFEPTSATVQPALLARGLLGAARERGVKVFEGSPMVALQRSRPLVVRTARASVAADRVVMAQGAWSAQLRELRRAFVIVSSDLVITDPVPAELERIGWRDGVSISDSRLMVHYYRTTRDGRIAFGKGGGRLAYGTRIGSVFTGRSPIEAEITARLRATYRSLGERADRRELDRTDRSDDRRTAVLRGAWRSRPRVRRRLLRQWSWALGARRADPRLACTRDRRSVGELRPRAQPSPGAAGRAAAFRRRPDRARCGGSQGTRTGRRASERPDR